MKAVFLDRDGTVNNDMTGYISDIKDFHLFPFATNAIKIFNQLNLKTIIVTNQSGIARGILNEDQLHSVHQYMLDECAKDKAIIDLILYSPYHKNGVVEPFDIEHISRKPNPGMFFEALKKFPLKAKQCYMIGDKQADILFGKNNGMTTILVKTGYGKQTWENKKNLSVKPDFVVENLMSAAILISFLEKN